MKERKYLLFRKIVSRKMKERKYLLLRKIVSKKDERMEVSSV